MLYPLRGVPHRQWLNSNSNLTAHTQCNFQLCTCNYLWVMVQRGNYLETSDRFNKNLSTIDIKFSREDCACIQMHGFQEKSLKIRERAICSQSWIMKENSERLSLTSRWLKVVQLVSSYISGRKTFSLFSVSKNRRLQWDHIQLRLVEHWATERDAFGWNRKSSSFSVDEN